MPRNRHIKIMHVCGSHEHSVQRWGLRSLLPENLEIIAGPGCPVCICPAFEIGEAISLAREGVIIATYGDMVRCLLMLKLSHEGRRQEVREYRLYTALWML